MKNGCRDVRIVGRQLSPANVARISFTRTKQTDSLPKVSNFRIFTSPPSDDRSCMTRASRVACNLEVVAVRLRGAPRATTPVRSQSCAGTLSLGIGATSKPAAGSSLT